jgi:hypothetical protein
VAGLLFPYTDPRSGFQYPSAFLVIDDARVHWAAQTAILGISIYGSEDLYNQGKEPIFRDTDLYLTSGELANEEPRFLGDLYGILQARPSFAGGTIVT